MNIAAILTVHNRREKTLCCLRHLFDALKAYNGQKGTTSTIALSVFVTDDGCTDGTANAIREKFPSEGIHVIQGDGNLFWAGGMRLAWQTAIDSGTPWDYFLLLNDDTFVHTNLFPTLLQASDYGQSLRGKRGIVSGIVCETGNESHIIYGGFNFANKTRGRNVTVMPIGKPQEVDLVSGNIMMVHSTVVDTIGIFHKGFRHDLADHDYNLSASRKGLPVVVTASVCGDCEYDHDTNEEQIQRLMSMSLAERKAYLSSPTRSDRDYLLLIRRQLPLRYPMTLLLRKLRLYMPALYYRISKFRGVYNKTKQPNDQNKRVLFVGFKHQQQSSILIGGGIANQRMIHTLQKLFGTDNVEQTYILDEEKGRPLWSYGLAVALFPFNYHNGITPQKVKRIVGLAQSYDYVFLSSSVLGILAKKLRESGYKGIVITHYHNVESIYYDAQMPRWLPGRQVVVNCAARNDEYGCRYSDFVVTLSQRDANYLNKHYHRQADAIIGIAMDDQFQPVDTSVLTNHRPHCLFLGAYSVPNNEGVLFFVQQVMPHVDVEFTVIGRGMSRLKKENECMSEIEVVSDAPDLRPFIEAADFMILPVFAGSGIKVKTCESLMYGKNILGSDESFEGYDLDASKVGGRCNTAEEYIERLNYFISNPVPRFNAYSRSIYLKNHTEESQNAVIKSLFLNYSSLK